MNDQIVLVGGGGHCGAVLDTIVRSSSWEVAGVVDPHPVENLPTNIAHLGDDSGLPVLANQFSHFLITVGQINSAAPRIRLSKVLEELGVQIPTIRCPSAVVSSTAEIGHGTVILPNAVIGNKVRIGRHCIINSGSIVEHDSTVGDYCHISTGAVVNGNCRIGSRSFVGSNATLIQGRTVGNDCVIGAGALVSSDFRDGIVAYGNPARARIHR